MTPNKHLYGDNSNSTTTPLAAGAEWTGTPRNLADAGYAGVIVAMKTDVDGTLFMEQSMDGVNWDSSLAFDVDGGLNEIHRITVTRQYFRARYLNNGANQTYLRLQTSYDNPTLLSSPLNSTLQQDADAIAIRSFPPELEIAAGRYQGVQLFNKFGRNADISTNSVPEDVIESGIYTGFPTTTAEEFQVFSSAADTGILTFSYLTSSSSTEYASHSVALNGTTPVNTGIFGTRAHTMRYDTGNATTFNAGTITLRWRTTTSVVFLTITPGVSQSNYAIFTIPSGSTGYIQSLFGAIRTNSAAILQGAIWARSPGQSPRLRRPFVIGSTARLNDEIYGGLSMSQGTDIALRITSASNNNTEITAGFDLVLVRNP